jgi:hypothetical protein
MGVYQVLLKALGLKLANPEGLNTGERFQGHHGPLVYFYYLDFTWEKQHVKYKKY